MKIIVLGSEGQLGYELVGALRHSAQFDVIPLCRRDIEFTSRSSLIESVSCKPDVVINTVAYNEVDQAEFEPEAASRVNHIAVGILGMEAKAKGFGLIHYSTDSVFDGESLLPYTEECPTSPINQYGNSKLAGEKILMDNDVHAIVLRTSWLYSLRRKSFVSTMLKMLQEPSDAPVRVVHDAVGSPTFCRDLAWATTMMLWSWRDDPGSLFHEHKGIYHASNRGSVSRYELAKTIQSIKGISPQKKVIPVHSDLFKLPAKRQKFSALDSSTFEGVFGISMPPWKDALQRALTGS